MGTELCPPGAQMGPRLSQPNAQVAAVGAELRPPGVQMDSRLSQPSTRSHIFKLVAHAVLDGRGLPHALVHDALGTLSGFTTASRARGGIQRKRTRELRAARGKNIGSTVPAPHSPSVRAPGH